MIKAFVTDAVVSKGYNGQDALKYSEDGKSVRFRIGKKVYDTRCENNTRWFNIGVKAFGAVCERIKKMQLKDGSYVSFIGKLDEDTWTDKETGETKTAMVIIVDDIEYTVSGGSNKDSNNQNRQNINSAIKTFIGLSSILGQRILMRFMKTDLVDLIRTILMNRFGTLTRMGTSLRNQLLTGLWIMLTGEFLWIFQPKTLLIIRKRNK